MYRIGEFSILNSVTIKALRYYDEIDLFKPKIVDNFTGYRYYDNTQIDEFKKILNYKNLGFSLDQIKKLKEDNVNEILENKINELASTNNANINKINTIKDMLGRNNIMKVKFRGLEEKYIIGKRKTIERKEVSKELSKIKDELNNLNIKCYDSVICNFEIGYEESIMDTFIGYQVSDNTIQKFNTIGDYNTIESTDLEIMMKSKSENFLITHCNKDELNEAYKEVIEYAHLNNIQIRDWFSEIYENNEVTLYVAAVDLKEDNADEMYHLEKFNSNFKEELIINDDFVGTYKIREILPSVKYMFNSNRKKSMLDTKYETIILNKDGTTNFDNIKWGNNKLLLKHENIIIPLEVYKKNIDGKEYIIIIMNETYDNYKSQLPLSYLYEKVK